MGNKKSEDNKQNKEDKLETIVRNRRYEITKPINMNWKDFGAALRKIQKEVRTVKNRSVVICMDYFNLARKYYEQTGAYPKLSKDNLLGISKGQKEIKDLRSFCYDVLYDKDKFVANSGNMDAEIALVTDIFEPSDKAEAKINQIRMGEERPPFYKKNPAITIKKQKSTKLSKEESAKGVKAGYYLKFGLFTEEYHKKLLEDEKIEGRGPVKVLIKHGNASQKSILDKVISGEYKISDSKLVYCDRKRKWYIHFAYKFTPGKHALNENLTMGVDLGYKNVAAMQIYDNQKNRYEWMGYRDAIIDGSEIIRFRNRLDKRRREIQRQTKVAGPGRIGHGIQAMKKPEKRIGDKVDRFKETYNNKVSKYIVDTAFKRKCKTIQLEDLTGFTKKTEDKFLKHWSYYDLQMKIEYKAAEKGINVVKVSPSYTSQRCSKCGTIHPDNRMTRDKFHCVSCDYIAHADINAAQNIAIPSIDLIIKAEVKSQKEAMENENEEEDIHLAF